MASRWSRFTNAVSRSIRSIFGAGERRQPPPAPPRPPIGPPIGGAPPRPPVGPVPGPRLPEAPPPGEPIGGPTMPPIGGGGGIGDGGYDEPWFGNEITLYDASGNPIPDGGGWTIREWHEELLRTKGELVGDYGLGNIDLIYQLMALGEWTDEDWAEFREDYEEAYG